jgi:hypothetical protein
MKYMMLRKKDILLNAIHKNSYALLYRKYGLLLGHFVNYCLM